MTDNVITFNAEKLVKECCRLFDLQKTAFKEIAEQRKIQLNEKLADLAATKKRMLKQDLDYLAFINNTFLKYSRQEKELHNLLLYPENHIG
jgi:predicted DNA binding CopG/RHH family protein